MEKYIDRYRVLDIVPKRRPSAHKGGFGTLSIIAGSACCRGAAVLAAGGALRTGAGIVRVVSTERVCAAVAPAYPGCTFLPVPEGADGCVTPAFLPELLSQKQTAILAGCGLGISLGSRETVFGLLAKQPCPMVLDADALNTLAGYMGAGVDVDEAAREEGASLLAQPDGPPRILTPHIGEMARLTGKQAGEIERDAVGAAVSFARAHHCVVVLKSHRTVVAAPDGTHSVYDRPNPGLAKGGSGDVLAGIIASLLAQGLAAEDAAAAGVWLHGEAAAFAADKKSETGMNPADLPVFLCEVWRTLGR